MDAYASVELATLRLPVDVGDKTPVEPWPAEGDGSTIDEGCTMEGGNGILIGVLRAAAWYIFLAALDGLGNSLATS